jgi:site-specific recombinase XerD
MFTRFYELCRTHSRPKKNRSNQKPAAGSETFPRPIAVCSRDQHGTALQLQINHFLDEQGRGKRRFWIKERKCGKRHEVVINTSIREILAEYLAFYPNVGENSNNFVFFNSKANNYSLPIKRGQAWKAITSICQDAGLSGNFGTHSLRKTWGYHARMQGVDLALIMHKLNHESIAYTKRYLGITDDELEAVINRLNL